MQLSLYGPAAVLRANRTCHETGCILQIAGPFPTFMRLIRTHSCEKVIAEKRVIHTDIKVRSSTIELQPCPSRARF